MSRRYESGPEGEFEPGSRGRVLRNLLGIRRVGDMQVAESQALDAAQVWAIGTYDSQHRFTADDICELHHRWLGGIYPWEGEYRAVNLSRAGFLFAAAERVPRLFQDYGRTALATETPCAGMNPVRLAAALASTHAELVLIHPFREGNGRCARLLALLMAMQAGLPTLDFWGFAGRGKRRYVAAIHAALDRDYAPMQSCFMDAIRRASAAFEESP
jgi:cell filamentation protein